VVETSQRARWISAAEFLVGAAVVIGHNVFRVLHNEVPILFVLALVSSRVREGSWRAIGFKRPESWTRVLIIAVGAVALRLLLGQVIEMAAARLWPPIVAPSGSENIAGNWRVALRWLGLVWTFAAVGEEVGYRGYLLTRAAQALGGSRAAWWAAVGLSAVLFGYGHYYKGPAGVLDSAVAGVILGAAYLLARRNLWAPILAHGLIDTVGVAAAFFGFDT
jgi:uncharacterized protein